MAKSMKKKEKFNCSSCDDSCPLCDLGDRKIVAFRKELEKMYKKVSKKQFPYIQRKNEIWNNCLDVVISKTYEKR